MLATGTMLKGLYTLDTIPNAESHSSSLLVDLQTWHQRFAHVNLAGIDSMEENGVVRGMKIATTGNQDDCVGCIIGKEIALRYQNIVLDWQRKFLS